MSRLSRSTHSSGKAAFLDISLCFFIHGNYLSVVRPDGKKKAYVRLTPDHDALDVANKVRKKWFIDTYELIIHAMRCRLVSSKLE